MNSAPEKKPYCTLHGTLENTLNSLASNTSDLAKSQRDMMKAIATLSEGQAEIMKALNGTLKDEGWLSRVRNIETWKNDLDKLDIFDAVRSARALKRQAWAFLSAFIIAAGAFIWSMITHTTPLGIQQTSTQQKANP